MTDESISDVESDVQPGAETSDGEPLNYEPWLEAMLAVARHYRLECSAENVRIAAQWNRDETVENVLRHMARQAGLIMKFSPFDASLLTHWRLPLVAQFRDGQVAALESMDSDGNVGVCFSGDRGLQSSVPLEQLKDSVMRLVILRPARSVADARVDDYVKPHEKHWFRRIVLRDLGPYGHVMLATSAANILALAGVLFSMQVYDRVIPAESLPTLYVLFGGVMLAIVFDFILRMMRVRITDLLGKRADIRVSDLVFGHAIRLKNSARPSSTGSFISQIRELEQIREMVTSTTATALADLPFFLLFAVVFWVIAGPLVAIPVAALLLLVIPGLLAQKKLREFSSESMRESSLRSATLVETIQGLEDIKNLQAEQRFQHQWNHYNAVISDVNLRQRFLVNTLTVWTHNVQTSIFAVVVLFGAPMVMAGDITTGSLVAASILGSRMMAPMAHITQVMSRWQQAKVALQGLDHIMQLPVDHPEGSVRVHKPAIRGAYQFKQAVFQYEEDALVPALVVPELHIEPGERIAVMGRNGAGKSTLLQALAGALEPASGEVSLDDVRMSHIDPADVRRDLGLLGQNSRLFHGTLRENLTMGAPQASDREILAALTLSGALGFIHKLPSGLGHMILEGGGGLSGGQRQMLLLARLLIREPHILLLDEPTASLDETSEQSLIRNLSRWSSGRTLIVATHRPSILSLVDRILLVDNGKLMLDDSREKVLAKLSRYRDRTAAKSEVKAV